MKTSIFVASAVLVAMSAAGASAQGPKGSYPLLSGNYLLQTTSICQPTLTVTYANGAVTDVNLVQANDANSTTTGTFTATQGSKKGTGTIALTATSASGDPFILTNNTGGQEGQVLQVGNGSDSVTFTQTATTLSLTDSNGTSTYNLYYGTAAGKDVGNAVFSGTNSKGCANSGSITLIQ